VPVSWGEMNLQRADKYKAIVNPEIGKVYSIVSKDYSLQGMDVHYMAPDEETLKEAMEKYTRWIDVQFQNVDQSVDQTKKSDKVNVDKDL
jgi:hypothetical protein